MQARRIGEFLSRLVPLTHHDIEEILHEQGMTGKRFGDIALALGLCRPEHIWHAWTRQLSQSRRRIDLESFGIDTQAVAHIPAEAAQRLRVVPLRVSGDEILIATHESNLVAAMQTLELAVKLKPVFVLTCGEQIDRAIEAHYPIAAVDRVSVEASAA